VKVRTPTRLRNGEGRVNGEVSTHAPVQFAGVVGTARRKGDASNRGRPVWSEGRSLNVADRRRLRRESDRVRRTVETR
jgi:hypothetical protein